MKYSSMFGIAATFMLAASLVAPVNLASPTPVEAAAGICKWDTISTPGSFSNNADILLGSEINKLVTSPTGMMLAVVTTRFTPPLRLYSSGNEGKSWGTASTNLHRAMIERWGTAKNVWDAAIAPDDSRFRAVVTSDNITDAPVEVWVTENSGSKWECTELVTLTGGGTPDNVIGCIDISPDYGGKRDIAVGIREGDGSGNFRIYVLQSISFANWKLQTVTPTVAGTTADILDLKFSPTYVGDSSLAVVFANANNTYYDVALRDLSNNDIASWVFDPTSVMVSDTNISDSPTASEIYTADLELPSDFSGQSASLRRVYISTDAAGTGNSVGIFRLDNSTVYVLMDTTGLIDKRISSIAYYGTYASGKLLAGEVLGSACTATVPTWFTDSPTTCPIPCWYPALKPTTGAGIAGDCSTPSTGQGNTQVAWSAIAKLAFVATGSSPRTAGTSWYTGFFLAAPINNDESAFGISRNNGETWNQTGLIDTRITKFNDVAPSADCTTIYLASASGVPGAAAACDEFDSVWRTSINSDVIAPYALVAALGSYWERVYCRPTALRCTETQSNLPLLRLAPAPDDEDGEIVFWAAQDPNATLSSGVAAWSPDFGDYWANINPRGPVQDFAAASNTVLFFLSPDGLVQKMPYTGTAWSSVEASVYSEDNGHMIATYGEDDVLVGYDNSATSTSSSP